MSSVAAVYDRRLERRVHRSREPYKNHTFTPQALIENHNVVPSLSPELAAQRPTPGKLSHKIQPLISREGGPREARIRTAANSPKIQNSTLTIQHCFPHPPTNPHPKSTVDLGCEELIRVENGLRAPLSPTCHRPIIWPENKGIKPKSNRHKPKNLSRLIDSDCELRSLCCLLWEVPGPSTFFRHPFCTLRNSTQHPPPRAFFWRVQSRFNPFLHANMVLSLCLGG